MPGGGGGNTQTTTTQSSTPWSGAQPFLLQALGGAQQAYQSGKGFSYPDFSTTVPFAGETTDALTGIKNLANGGNPLGIASQNATLGLLNHNGQTPDMASAGSGFQGLLGSASMPDAVRQSLGNYASGINVNGGSPEFLKALDTQSGKVTDDINRGWSNAGRFGSAGQGNDVAQQVGNLRTSAIANEIAREQGQQIQAAGMLSGEQQQGIGNQVGILGNIAGIGAQGAGNLATAVGQAPGVYGQQYAPYEKLAGVGAANEDYATRLMNENVARFQANQQNPWARLSAYNALIGGAGQLGSTTTTSVPKPSALQGLLGGGLLGAQVGAGAGGLPGALIGGGLGGLLGYFG